LTLAETGPDLTAGTLACTEGGDLMWSIWDVPSDRDYYSQFRPDWDPEEEIDEANDAMDQPGAVDDSLEPLSSEECPF
jgi:hypothetical protein